MTQELGRPYSAPAGRLPGSWPAYNRKTGSGGAVERESEGVIVPVMDGTTKPAGGKRPYFIDARVEREGSVSAHGG